MSLASLMKKVRQKVKQQSQALQQQQDQQPQSEASAPSELAGVFTSKKGAPVTETGNTKNAQINDEENKGLLGNIRKTLFSGGISSGGIFSYGKRQSSNGIIGRLFG
jgi:hypothetical protein